MRAKSRAGCLRPLEGRSFQATFEGRDQITERDIILAAELALPHPVGLLYHGSLALRSPTTAAKGAASEPAASALVCNTASGVFRL